MIPAGTLIMIIGKKTVRRGGGFFSFGAPAKPKGGKGKASIAAAASAAAAGKK